jgi:hypothetical protein
MMPSAMVVTTVLGYHPIEEVLLQHCFSLFDDGFDLERVRLELVPL